jgi:phosphoglycerol transferase MdoB-like AlkP superfamily enzyme
MTKLFPARYALLLWVAAVFLALNTSVRAALLFFEGSASAGLSASGLAVMFATGLLYDVAALAYLLVPFALLALVWPNSPRGRRGHAISATALLAVVLAGLLLTAVAEGVFWNEFASRFNFIAVDYLVYTREVIGNVQQSYPVGIILSGIGAVAVCIGFLLRRPVWHSASASAGSRGQRFAATALVLALPVLGFLAVGDAAREAVATAAGRELAGNGPYEFMRAYRSNDLDFRKFYRTLAPGQAQREVRTEFAEAGSTARFTGGGHPLEREVRSGRTPKPHNVVMVSIESLGSDFVESFGGKPGLTPNLDRMAREGLMFTNVYATGLRTVRGLEALTLSIPPTPGHAVPMRANNKGFQTIGGVFKDQGYEALYVYGGYSRFDNMRDFFGGNGYTVIDRSAIEPIDISHETIWGVADEDLFRLAVREIDARAAAGTKVFTHVMTTTNHRPFTYPANRIDIASGTGRDGAVKYTDWAIGEFVRLAASRPWFSNTVFVFVADHTSNGRGRTNLPPANYRIPLIVYAPGIVAPGRVDTLASQIDVAPTVLALLDVSYTSRFFGQDILTEGRHHPRAFMANYLTVGYMQEDRIVELTPKRGVKVVNAQTGLRSDDDSTLAAHLSDEASAYYELATQVLRGVDAGAAILRQVFVAH